MAATALHAVPRRLLCSLLLVTVLWQGWAQASMVTVSSPLPAQDCAGHMATGDDCDCCPAGAAAQGACHALCSASVALTATPSVVFPTSVQVHSVFVARLLANPRYIPLNPPPIA